MHDCARVASGVCSAQSGHVHVPETVTVVLAFVAFVVVARWARVALRTDGGE